MGNTAKKRRPAGAKRRHAAMPRKKKTAGAARPAAVRHTADIAPEKPKATAPAEHEKPAVTAETPVPAAADTEAARAKVRKRHLRALRSLLIRVLLLALVVYILFFHIVGITIMPSGDMYPRIDAGDMVVYYRLENTVRAQDVIVFRKPTASLDLAYHQQENAETARPEKTAIRKALDWLGFADPADPPMTTFVCRVVAGPGDTVEVTDGERLLVNGNAVIETNIFYNTPRYEGFVEYPLTLGENQYFVLADYRNGGADSRFFGVVNRDEILGTVITILRRNNL